jgi:hypothetical protein
MNACPDIETLLQHPAPDSAHLDSCAACRGVSALVNLRHERILGHDDACERAELNIALHHEGLLNELEHVELVEHLERCTACNETAARMLALPPVETTSIAQLDPEPARLGGVWGGVAIGFGVAAAIAAVAFGITNRSAPPASTAVAEKVGEVQMPAPVSSAVGGTPVVPVVPIPAAPPIKSAPPAAPDKHGFLTLACMPTCTSVVVDGTRQLGSSPIVRAKLPVGNHTVVGRGEGGLRRTVSLTIVEGQTVSRNLKLEKFEPSSDVLNPWADNARPNPYLSEHGFLTVVCNPACDSVVVQGKNLGPSPIVRHTLPVGSHTLGLSKGGKKETRTVSISANKTTAIRIRMNELDVGF